MYESHLKTMLAERYRKHHSEEFQVLVQIFFCGLFFTYFLLHVIAYITK